MIIPSVSKNEYLPFRRQKQRLTQMRMSLFFYRFF